MIKEGTILGKGRINSLTGFYSENKTLRPCQKLCKRDKIFVVLDYVRICKIRLGLVRMAGYVCLVKLSLSEEMHTLSDFLHLEVFHRDHKVHSLTRLPIGTLKRQISI
jgi:hypothetical protein